MNLSDRSKAILHLLRDGRPHTLEQVYNDLDIAPFEAQALLKQLTRLGLVRDYARLEPLWPVEWVLTDRGFWDADGHYYQQLEIS